MSTADIKDRIAKMSPEERDDIRLYLAGLDDTGPELSAEWIKNIKQRSKAIKSGETPTRPYDEVMAELGFRK